MNRSVVYSIKAGLAATVLGLLFFIGNRLLFDFNGGPIWGYYLVLLPGNLSLNYVWHPLFTEEINFWPKLILLLIGQFSTVSGIVLGVLLIKQKLTGKE